MRLVLDKRKAALASLPPAPVSTPRGRDAGARLIHARAAVNTQPTSAT